MRPREHLEMSGDVSVVSLGFIWVVMVLASILRVEARDAAIHPTMHRTADNSPQGP